MKSIVQVIGALLFLSSIRTFTKFLKTEPNLDLVGNPSHSGEATGTIIMGLLGIGLVVYGLQKSKKEPKDTPDQQQTP